MEWINTTVNKQARSFTNSLGIIIPGPSSNSDLSTSRSSIKINLKMFSLLLKN